MKNIVNSKVTGSFATSLVLGIVFGYISVFILLFIFAFILMASDIGDGASVVFATISLAVSGLVCGYIAAKKLGSKALIIGLLAGMVYYLTVTIVSLIISGGGITNLFLIRLVLTTCMSGIGAFFSTLKKKSKNFI